MADLSAGTFVLVSSGVVNEVCCIVDCWEANGAGEPAMKVNVFREVSDNFHLENVREVTDPTLQFFPKLCRLWS